MDKDTDHAWLLQAQQVDLVTGETIEHCYGVFTTEAEGEVYREFLDLCAGEQKTQQVETFLDDYLFEELHWTDGFFTWIE